jgi:peptidoglycan hydrolase-like protein with peptidoglycan-binding domain
MQFPWVRSSNSQNFSLKINEELRIIIMECLAYQELALSYTQSAPPINISQPTSTELSPKKFPLLARFTKILLAGTVLAVSMTMSNTTLAETILQRGQRGEQVRSLQTALKNQGYFTGNVTDFYGTKTENAVKKFQRERNLSPTGQVDRVTWNSIFQPGWVGGSSQIPLFPPSTTPISPKPNVNRVLAWGEISPEVGLLQQRLQTLGFYNGPINNTFDVATRAAVIQFQRQRGILPVSGEVGPTTWQYLFSFNPVVGNTSGGNYPNFGDTGSQVIVLQQRLTSLGFYQGAIDGYFHDATRQALINFQQSRNITPVGQVGPTTWNALFNNMMARPPVPPLPNGLNNSLAGVSPIIPLFPFAGCGNTAGSGWSDIFKTLSLGSQGIDVVFLQRLLVASNQTTGGVDGIFGRGTENAVKSFQASKGICNNGVVGVDTWLALLSANYVGQGGAGTTACPYPITALVNSFPNMAIENQSLLLGLQQWLNFNGFYQGPFDGTNNPQLRQAVSQVQLMYGVRPEGN